MDRPEYAPPSVDQPHTSDPKPGDARTGSRVGIWSWHVPTDQVSLSAETYRIYGIDPKAFGGTFDDCLEVIHADDLPKVREVTLRALEQKHGMPVEFRVLGDGGLYRLVRADADVFLDANGEVERMAGMVQDITAERADQLRQRRLAEAVEQVAEVVLIADPTGVVKYVNAAFEATTGYGRDEVIGKQPAFLRHATTSADDVDEMCSTLGRGEAWVGRLRGRHKDGTSFLVDATVSPVHGEDSTLVNYVAVQRDVTREVALKAELQHFQKMEAVGMLAGGIAHDFNNLLIAIIGHSDLLLLKTDEHPDLNRHAGAIRKAGERARELTAQLLAFGRKQILQPERLDVNEVLRDQESLLRRVIGDSVEMTVSGSASPALIHADAGQIEQVIQNLVRNAREAMPAGGHVDISIRHVELGPEACQLLGSAEPGRHVVITVRDTGMGMDDETRERIFEPFFTTKGMQLGTGLGLATVYGIVRQSGGGVRVQSELGRGTCFEVCLPEDTSPSRRQPVRSRPPEGASGNETILVAEDEPLVATIVKSTLRAHGYTVLFAEDGERALEVAADHDGPIDLLFTDVVMPRMDGVALVKRLLCERPATKVLYSSGYTNSALQKRGALIEGVDLLQKPYNATTLLTRVREKLDCDQGGTSRTGS